VAAMVNRMGVEYAYFVRRGEGDEICNGYNLCRSNDYYSTNAQDKMRQLQQDMADSLKKLAMSEANVEVMEARQRRQREQLETERTSAQRNAEKLSHQVCSAHTFSILLCLCTCFITFITRLCLAQSED